MPGTILDTKLAGVRQFLLLPNMPCVITIVFDDTTPAALLLFGTNESYAKP